MRGPGSDAAPIHSRRSGESLAKGVLDDCAERQAEGGRLRSRLGEKLPVDRDPDPHVRSINSMPGRVNCLERWPNPRPNDSAGRFTGT
jgi:hypothetical protein